MTLTIPVDTTVSRIQPATANILDLEPGIYVDYPAERYHAKFPGLASKSGLDRVHKSPATYLAWLNGALEQTTDAMGFGKALHCAVLEPNVFARTYVVQPDFGDLRFKENKSSREAWRRDVDYGAPGAPSVITADDMRNIRGMSNSIRDNKYASRMISEGASEVTMRWVDPNTGVQCKGRVDYYVPKMAGSWDVKSCEDARASAFARSIANYRYHVQQAFYSDAFRILGRPLEFFAFIAVEKSPPYLLKVYMIDSDDVADGWEEAQADLAKLALAYETGVFPGYPEGITTIARPEWARRASEREDDDQ